MNKSKKAEKMPQLYMRFGGDILKLPRDPYLLRVALLDIKSSGLGSQPLYRDAKCTKYATKVSDVV